MRVAALYDVHGNLPALEAVLADVRGAGVDRVLVGGDVVAGPFPAETLALLRSLDDVAFIRGNADRDLDPSATAEGDVWAVRTRWVARRLTLAQRDFLATLPQRMVLDVDGLGEVLFCHGSPRSDEEIVTRLSTERRLASILTGVDQRTVVCGHTHVQFDRRVGELRLVNAGSVGLPYEGRPGAYWAVVGPDVALRRTAYDLDDAAARIRATGYPDPDELLEHLAADDPALPDQASEFFERTATERDGKL